MNSEFYIKPAAKIFTKIFAMICFVGAALFAINANAQNINTYIFSQSTGTYTSIGTGTSALGPSIDDLSGTVQNIGFNFVLAGNTFTQFVVQSNGYICLGNTIIQNYVPLSINPNCIAFGGGDGRSGPSGIYYAVTGNAPNRVLTIEEPSYYITYQQNNDHVDVQIKLYETSDVIEIIYNNAAATAPWMRQVGITGATTGDFSVRTNSTNWSATTAAVSNMTLMTWSSSVFPANGQIYTWTPPSPCSGQPTAGTTVSTTDSACTGVPFTLSLSGATIATGLTYQWQSSPTNSGFINITGATSSTYTTTQSTAAYYRCLVTCINSSLSDSSVSLLVIQNPPLNCYCIPPPSTFACSSMHISNVTTTGGITNFNNSSGCSASSLSDFSSSVIASQYQGQNITISVTSFGLGLDCNVYIDYNDNGIFDPSELVLQMGNTSAGTVTGTIPVSIFANPGTHRMRVRAEYYAYGYPAGPCTQLTYGETEDYGFTVVVPPVCTGTPTPGNTLISMPCASVCSGTGFTLSLQSFFFGSSVTYQWYSSPNDTTYTAISGATATTYATSQTTETWYECVVTCTSSTDSAVSTPLNVVMGSSAQCTTYCLPTFFGTTNTCSYINSVTTTGGLSNITAPVDSGFTSNLAYAMNYFACPVVSQYAGGSFTLTVQAHGTCGTAFFSVWADWNHNGIFDAGEKLVDNVSCGNSITNFTINIPLTAVIGPTRLRIIDFTGGSSIGPCDNLSSYNGEGEDYQVTVVTPPPCSGTPSPGNTIASANPVCSSATLTLSLQNNPVNSAFTYQWYSSPNNITYTAISGATAITYSTTQSTETWYECVVTCSVSSLSDTSAPVDVMINPLSNCFCIPPASVNYLCCGLYIKNVTITGGVTNFNNTTSFATNSYANYTTTVVASQVRSSSVTIKCTSAGYGLYYNIYVDYNDNGIFDAGELVLQMGTTVAGPVSGSFTVPASAPYGIHQMRIRGEYYVSGYPTGPCTQLQYGETEDYGFNVILFTGNNELTPGNTLSIYPNPLTSSSILQLNTKVTNAEVVIYDMLGKEMMRKKLTGDRMEIEKGSLESGVYFVRVRSEERQWVEKMVVE
jgi:hypothetical protein